MSPPRSEVCRSVFRLLPFGKRDLESEPSHDHAHGSSQKWLKNTKEPQENRSE